MIGTRLHHLAEFVQDPLVDEMLAAAKFVMSPEVFELAGRPDAAKAINAMIQAGMMHLPYDPVVIEFVASRNLRWFVLMTEGDECFRCRVAAYCEPSGEAMTYDGTFTVQLIHGGRADPDESYLRIEASRDTEAHALACGSASAFALLMLNTKGIEKEVIHVDKINKARAKHHDGRQLIPQHTIIRIGTIYDRSGKGHRYSGFNGRHMPVHLRSSHARHQHFGKGNEDIKLIWIPPCLVNYRDGSGDKPKIPEKEVRV